MNSENPFETLSGKVISCGRFTIVSDTVRVNGHEQPYDYIRIRPGVCVLAEYKGYFILQKQFRYPVSSWQWELPGGFIDEGETPEEAAARELLEETGYISESINGLGCFYPSFGSTDEKIYLFHIVCSEKTEAKTEPGEAIRNYLMTFEGMKKLILENEFCHGAGLAAWGRYLGAVHDSSFR